MANIDLSKYGITGAVEVLHNPSYEVLFQEETKAGLEGFEKGQETELGAVNVMTGVYTGRSPKDKFFVMDEVSKDTVKCLYLFCAQERPFFHPQHQGLARCRDDEQEHSRECLRNVRDQDEQPCLPPC